MLKPSGTTIKKLFHPDQMSQKKKQDTAKGIGRPPSGKKSLFSKAKGE